MNNIARQTMEPKPTKDQLPSRDISNWVHHNSLYQSRTLRIATAKGIVHFEAFITSFPISLTLHCLGMDIIWKDGFPYLPISRCADIILLAISH
jgi:hypothetical protein